MTVRYNKPFLTVPQQISLLRERGMIVPDDDLAANILRAVGYYRFSGYFYPFREFPTNAIPETEDQWMTRVSEFAPETNFNDVHNIYEFDRKIRMRIFDGIEKFEISFRFAVGHLLAQFGQFAHRDGNFLDRGFVATKDFKFIQLDGSSKTYQSNEHAAWLNDLDKQENRSQEAFVLHHKNKYGLPLPIWKSTEVMSFGTLVRLYDGLKQHHRQQIAADLDILDPSFAGDSATLSNWLNHIRYIRNTCAHHSRLWNRSLDVILTESRGIPELAHLSSDQQRSRVYGTISVLAYLLTRTHPENTWRLRTIQFVRDEAAQLGLDMTSMGFPPGWESEALWADTYKRDEERASRVQLLSELDTVTSSEATALLHSVDQSHRKSKLTYLRGKHALLGLKISKTYQYPKFQFDSLTGTVHSQVIEANRRIYVSMFEQSDDQIAWAAVKWWLSPIPADADRTPLAVLQAGQLSVEYLDNFLPGTAEDPA